ncbi:four-carbon acid sugar kinase family protein [Flavisericum labens]|uniref:four-carbon acid sugar kinase family protein n=1 Tax=Flavisericum labens TaxID=3377112 RepID=UPI00387B6D0F
MITVIADDLTGAAEIAGVCIGYGIDVSFGIGAIPKQLSQVVIVATDSRSLTEEEAYQQHQQLARKVFKKNAHQVVYKKCDSVLRGHVLTELLALMSASGKKLVLLQPANPKGQRCIKNGVYFINDKKIENTGFLTDPDFPANVSSIKEMLLSRTSEKDVLLIQTGCPEHISSEGIYIPDVQSEAQLAGNLKLYNENVLIGGSAAFFEQFLKKLNLTSTKKKFKTIHFNQDFVLVSGSTHPESLAYAMTLEKKGCPLVTFPNHLLMETISDNDLVKFTEEIVQIYSQNRKLIVRISDKNIQFKNSSKVLKNRLSLVLQQLLTEINFKELFIEGGATAYDILKKLNWNAFTPKETLAEGVVRMAYNLDKSKHITLKPGSYKWPERLLN